MKKRVFLKTIFVSFLGHLAAFGIFSFSFPSRGLSGNYPTLSFWGGVLTPADFLEKNLAANLKPYKINFVEKYLPQNNTIDKERERFSSSSPVYFKPLVKLASNTEKNTYSEKFSLQSPLLAKLNPTVVLHPVLPYHFGLYFKDRQVVHIELMYNLIPSAKTNSIIVQRKIASGNLEVDLLSMHYISHYLFIQQSRLDP